MSLSAWERQNFDDIYMYMYTILYLFIFAHVILALLHLQIILLSLEFAKSCISAWSNTWFPENSLLVSCKNRLVRFHVLLGNFQGAVCLLYTRLLCSLALECSPFCVRMNFIFLFYAGFSSELQHHLFHFISFTQKIKKNDRCFLF